MGTQEPADDASGPPPSLRQALRDCAVAGLSGVLEVTGEPGGTICFSGGGVVAVETPGAPSTEVILLRSGRIAEADWAAAFAAAAAGGYAIGPELVIRGLIGAGELEAVLRLAVADAMFVLSGGLVEACRVEPEEADSQFVLEPPADVGWLLAEASRRMRVLASSRGLVEHDRDRMAAAPGAVQPGVLLGQGQDEILALANGRRTARDMAFALGQGVYATTLQLVRMYGAGLLVTASQRAVTLGEQAQASQPAAVPVNEPGAASPLPRRRKGRAQHRRESDSDAGADLPSLLRLLRPRSGGEVGSPQVVTKH
jgi:hypothetical protein